MKVCSKCSEKLPTSSFGETDRSADGLLWWCKDCLNSYGKEYRKAETQCVKDRRNKKRRIFSNTPMGKYNRRVEGFRKMGLSIIVYVDIMNKQKGCCAICKESLIYSYSLRDPHIDHNHKTGEVRGILCCGCNSGLGGFKDNPDICMRGATYLLSSGYYG